MSGPTHEAPVHIVYLSNGLGEPTNIKAPADVLVSDTDWQKVPFDEGPGNVLPYLGAVDGRPALIAHLECPYADPWWLHDANLYPLRASANGYFAAAVLDLQSRVNATIPVQILPVDDNMPGRLVLRVALDLASVRDREHALATLRGIFGSVADMKGYPSFAEDAEALADSCGGFWSTHPDHPIEGWQHDVAEGDTRLGYWDWVVAEVRRGIDDAVSQEISPQRPAPGSSP
ncbi:hypothetical protein [Dolichospermum phage Dfl-JY45]